VTPSNPAFTVHLGNNNQIDGVTTPDSQDNLVTPTATVNVSYAATATVNLTLQPAPGNEAYAGYASVAPSVQLNEQASATFPINIVGNPADGATAIFTITASLGPDVGAGSPKTATFSVKGVVILF
jgi:hypothetical protein